MKTTTIEKFKENKYPDFPLPQNGIVADNRKMLIVEKGFNKELDLCRDERGMFHCVEYITSPPTIITEDEFDEETGELKTEGEQNITISARIIHSENRALNLEQLTDFQKFIGECIKQK